MTRRQSAAARRERARETALLRGGVESGDGTVVGTDRRVRRLVFRGLAENPRYAYGAARGATATITEAGRQHVAAADKGDEM